MSQPGFSQLVPLSVSDHRTRDCQKLGEYYTCDWLAIIGQVQILRYYSHDFAANAACRRFVRAEQASSTDSSIG